MAERWEEIARELGSYDLEWVGHHYTGGYELVPVDEPHGDWVKAEPACKRIAELEDLQVRLDLSIATTRQLQEACAKAERERDVARTEVERLRREHESALAFGASQGHADVETVTQLLVRFARERDELGAIAECLDMVKEDLAALDPGKDPKGVAPMFVNDWMRSVIAKAQTAARRAALLEAADMPVNVPDDDGAAGPDAYRDGVKAALAAYRRELRRRGHGLSE